MNKNAVLFALFAGLLLLLPAAAQAAPATPAEPPVLMVDGSGKAVVSPDRATISVGVVSQSADAKEAQAKNARKAAAIQAALVANGIPQANIQTRGYYFHPLYESQQRGHENDITGYQAENTVTVLVEDITAVGKVIDLALDNGANSISSLEFSAKNTSKVRKDALNAAVRDARAKADELAAALGRHVVGLKSVSESTYPLANRSLDSKMLSSEAASTPIAPGTLEMSADVHIEYYLSE